MHFVVPRGSATIDEFAAGVHRLFARHLGILRPQQRTAARVESMHATPAARDVNDAIDNQGRRFSWACVEGQIAMPRELELGDVLRGDLREGTEAVLVLGAAVSHPVARITPGRAQSCRIDCGKLDILGPRRIRCAVLAAIARGEEAREAQTNERKSSRLARAGTRSGAVARHRCVACPAPR